MSREQIEERIRSVNWYHEFDFGDGLIARPSTPDIRTHRALWGFIQGELDRLDFADKTVLDIGCWDGYWSFYAERRGAASVLASDDTSQNWAGSAGFLLARDLLKSCVHENLTLSVYDLTSLGQRFDVVLCLGVYYHLLDPFYAFAQVRHCCKRDSVAVFEGDVLYGPRLSDTQSIALYSPETTLAPRFVPDRSTLRMLLGAAYFDVQREVIFDPNTLTTIAEPQSGVFRTICICKPARSINSLHLYQPPFGLSKYDLRRKLPPQEWLSYLPRPGYAPKFVLPADDQAEAD